LENVFVISDASLTQLKTADPDRCRAAMMADAKGRDRLLCLYAFHHELAKVPEMVSEPMLGDIRYQWWRDVLSEIFENKPVRKHEVSTPLAAVFQDTDMPRFWADRLIDGRARDLDPTPFANIEAAREYCQQTSGVLMQMAVKCLGGEPDDMVMKVGEAWGLAGLARAWRYYHKSMLSELLFEDLTAAATQSYQEAQKFAGDEHKVFPAIGYAALIPKYIMRLTKSGHNPAEDVAQYAPFLKQMHLIRAAITGKI